MILSELNLVFAKFFKKISAFNSNGKFAYEVPFDHFLAFRFHAADENEFVIGIRTTKKSQIDFFFIRAIFRQLLPGPISRDYNH